MINQYKVLAIVPARGRSVRIPQKNTKLLAGKPLVEYTFEQIKESNYIDRSILITDDPQIAAIGKQYNIEWPFVEPDNLADGTKTDLEFFTYALEWLKEHENYVPDIVVQLRPTSPLRTVEHINKAIEMLVGSTDCDSVRTVSEPEQSPYKMYSISESGLLKPLMQFGDAKEPFNLPQASLPKVYKHIGYVDVMWSKTIFNKKMMTGDKILPLIVEDGISGINTMRDWEYYEFLIKKNGNISH